MAPLPLPDAVPLPSPVVVKDDAVRRQVVGQHTPGGAGAEDVADGVDDFPAVVFDGSSAGFGRRQQGFQELPFGVVEVAGVGCTVHNGWYDTPEQAPPAGILHGYLALFRHALTSEEQRETAEPGRRYYLGPLVYRGAEELHYCPGTVYSASCSEGAMAVRSYPLYYTKSALREITLPPLFSN